MKKITFILVSSLMLTKLIAQQGIPNQPMAEQPKNVYTKYNSATFGTQGGKSLTTRAASMILYNFNQFSITNRLYVSTYSEYYKDWNNLFFSNYLNAQGFMNYKLPKLFIVGVGYRFHNNFEVNQRQNFIQFKVEKTFTW